MRSPSVLLLLGVLAVAVAAGRTWLVVATTDVVLGESSIDVSGRGLSAATSGVLVLAAAAGLVAVLTRGWPQRVAATVLLLDGLWALWVSVSVVVQPRAAATRATEAGSGTSTGLGVPTAVVDAVEVSVWPWAFALGAVLICAGALAVLWAGRPGHRARSAPRTTADRPAPTGADLPATERRRRENARAWEELSDGNDLTP